MKPKYIVIIFAGFIFLIASCVKNSDYIINDGLNPGTIIKFSSITPNTALADSNTEIVIRVAINSNTDSAENVMLTTSSGTINGKLNSESMSVNVNRFADFIFKTGQISGPISLRASIMGSYFCDTVLTLGIAYPDTIIIQPDEYTVSGGSALHANINFMRYEGYPSQGQAVLLNCVDPSGNSLGQFTYSDSFVPGTPLKAVFTAPTSYTGKALLQAFVIKKDGTRLLGQLNITIQ